MIWNKSLTRRPFAVVVALLLSLLPLAGCGVYSFTGTNLDPSIENFSVAVFQNNASNGPSFLSQRFTEDMKDYFLRNTTLKLVPRDGHLQFEGQIVAYDFAPAAIQSTSGQDQAGINRLTIQIRVKFTNLKDPKQDFEQTFQSNADFAASTNIQSILNDPVANRRITDRIITDVFNKSAANW
ncbi:hypothetical protein EJV47_06535 [Hymenobacter gummosus]|uniref:LptE family protein n=1 Tax=Hymenobacter gummosus TaxID=1776032 RepID=A0A3S0H6N5_9BACT|nr:LptE family protein [Hymenobacter gummosus]RTQ51455.1 hypothetical protein EJV47_06535 [Hymenobacter gummosus]